MMAVIFDPAMASCSIPVPTGRYRDILECAMSSLVDDVTFWRKRRAYWRQVITVYVKW